MMDSSKGAVLIDCDILCYQFGFPHEDTKSFGVIAKQLDNFIQGLLDKFSTDEWYGFLTGKGNYREQLAVTHKYKGNRVKPKPKWFKDIREYLMYVHDVQVIHHMEADDALAMHMTANPLAICCTIDKDLRTVEGWHYSWGRGDIPEKPLEYITEYGYVKLKENRKDVIGGGAAFLYSQALTGDKVDNIIGLQGYGPVAAVTALEGCTTELQLHEVVKRCYEEAGEPYSRLVENMQLLWMTRELDNDNKPVLWRGLDE